MRVTDKHVFFFGKQDVFSQWYPCSFTVDGITFNCAEQAMMYFKAQVFEDNEIAAQILESKNPKEQKALGRKVKGFDTDAWNACKIQAITSINYAKFAQNKDLKRQLMETENRDLVEASPYDKIWGIGMGSNDPGVDDPKNWKGKNLLGKCLVTVRSLIRGLDEAVSSLKTSIIGIPPDGESYEDLPYGQDYEDHIGDIIEDNQPRLQGERE